MMRNLIFQKIRRKDSKKLSNKKSQHLLVFLQSKLEINTWGLKTEFKKWGVC